MVRLLGLLSVVLLMLTGFSPSETWNQRLTLVIETPQGEVRGAVVQRIDWEGTGATGTALFGGVDPSSASVRVTGEGLAVEVMPGRWLLALLKGGEGWQGEPGLNAGVAIAVPRGHFAKSAEGGARDCRVPEGHSSGGPREAWPMRVTFDDIGKPETVRKVDPEDLAAVFGEGVRVKAVALEITEAVVTGGPVEGVLGWMPDYPEAPILPKVDPMDFGFSANLRQADFIRESNLCGGARMHRRMVRCSTPYADLGS